AIGLVEVIAYRRHVGLLLAVDKGVWLTFAAAGALSMAGIAHDAFRSASPIARRRARVVLTGAVLAFLLPMIALVAFFLLAHPVSGQLLASTGIVFPLAIGYAVARHDLFEADRVVKLSLTYAGVTAIVSLVYGLLVLGAERVAAGAAVTTSPAFPLAFVLVALVTIVPLRDRVQRAVDRLFYRASVDYKETVARASDRLTTLLDRDAIVGHVLTTVRDVLFID